MTWIPSFLRSHRNRLRPPNWPKEGSDEYFDFISDWTAAIERDRVTQSEAASASEACARSDSPPKWKGDHIPAVIRAVNSARSSGSVSMSLDEARISSGNCEYCSGQGMTSVYHPEPNWDQRVAPTAAAYCLCPLGQAMKTRANPPPQWDLRDVIAGRVAWRVDPPEWEDETKWPRVTRNFEGTWDLSKLSGMTHRIPTKGT